MDAIDYAKEGMRLKVDGKTIWQGLGNRSGLHSYAYELLSQKWKKSGPRFEKKLEALPPGTQIEVQRFKNITRDRGRWHTVKTLTVDKPVTVSGSDAPPAAMLRRFAKFMRERGEEVSPSSFKVVRKMSPDESPFIVDTWLVNLGWQKLALPNHKKREWAYWNEDYEEWSYDYGE
jgi:hypothetical protein